MPTSQAGKRPRTVSEYLPGRFIAVDNGGWERFARAVYRERNGRIIPDYDLNLGLAMSEGTPGGRPAQSATVNLWPLFAALSGVPALLLRGGTPICCPQKRLGKCRAQNLISRSRPSAGADNVPFLDEPEAVATIDAFLNRIE
jgi:hypothetical protein